MQKMKNFNIFILATIFEKSLIMLQINASLSPFSLFHAIHGSKRIRWIKTEFNICAHLAQILTALGKQKNPTQEIGNKAGILIWKKGEFLLCAFEIVLWTVMFLQSS